MILRTLLILSQTVGLSAAVIHTSSEKTKKWIQEALNYGFDLNTTDYTKYMSEKYVEHINGKIFNFDQWLHHMSGLKAMMKSYELSFDEILVDNDKIATSYIVHATKQDGTELDVRVIAIFKIKDQKMVYCDELTYLLNGPAADKDLPSQN